MSTKYTRDRVEQAVQNSKTLAGVLRELNVKWSGGQQQNIRRWIDVYKIDTSHFVGQAVRKGCSRPRIVWQNILTKKTLDRRERSHLLRRALLDYGKPYVCIVCGNDGHWNGKELRLQVDHKDGNWSNNEPDNLEFICPNCHSQTTGWSGQKGNTTLTSATSTRKKYPCQDCQRLVTKLSGRCKSCSAKLRFSKPS